jgi:hypothetical protein
MVTISCSAFANSHNTTIITSMRVADDSVICTCCNNKVHVYFTSPVRLCVGQTRALEMQRTALVGFHFSYNCTHSSTGVGNQTALTVYSVNPKEVSLACITGFDGHDCMFKRRR